MFLRGPFWVAKVISPCVYRIVDCSNSRKKYVVHLNRLKPAPTKEEQGQFPQQKKQWEDDSGESTPEHARCEEEEEYIIEESSEKGDRQDRQGVMTDPERNAVQPQDGDHLMSAWIGWGRGTGSGGRSGQRYRGICRGGGTSITEVDKVQKAAGQIREPIEPS